MNGQAIVFDQETGTPVRVEFLRDECWGKVELEFELPQK
jgi:hypothetical protein